MERCLFSMTMLELVVTILVGNIYLDLRRGSLLVTATVILWGRQLLCRIHPAALAWLDTNTSFLLKACSFLCPALSFNLFIYSLIAAKLPKAVTIA